ncbi:hypothetical protein ACFYPC_35240 [Streptomyces sp. NPDC005808]|uniref:hypothetical protein n=1 Tax=Streptomyces sp. NPDC005808 TaxID=3364734 RepID=UPI00367E94C6
MDEQHGATGGYIVDGQGVAVAARRHSDGPDTTSERRSRTQARGGTTGGYGPARSREQASGPAEGQGFAAGGARVAEAQGPAAEEHEEEERVYYRPLWVEEPARRRRLPDPVRTAAVRALLIVSVTLIQAMVAFLSTLAGSWLAFPMVLSSVASTVVATWAALDVWVTRQVWNQRHGVVSVPSSTARALRRERRRARRQARTDEGAQERIRRQGGASQLSHS